MVFRSSPTVTSGRLFRAVLAHLGVADVGHQGVAQALAADGVFDLAALGQVVGDRFGGAAVADVAVSAWRRARAGSRGRRRVSVPRLHRDPSKYPGACATLKGKPVGEASGSVKTSPVPAMAWAISRFLRSARMPDSRENAKAVPTWMPAAPCSSASRSFRRCRSRRPARREHPARATPQC